MLPDAFETLFVTLLNLIKCFNKTIEVVRKIFNGFLNRLRCLSLKRDFSLQYVDTLPTFFEFFVHHCTVVINARYYILSKAITLQKPNQ